MSEQNKAGLLPVDFKVLLEQHKAEDITAGGIVIAPATVEKEQWKVSRCDVIALGGRAFTDLEGTRWEGDIPIVGDVVIVREYSGFSIKGADGEMYQLVSDKDILCIDQTVRNLREMTHVSFALEGNEEAVRYE